MVNHYLCLFLYCYVLFCFVSCYVKVSSVRTLDIQRLVSSLIAIHDAVAVISKRPMDPNSFIIWQKCLRYCSACPVLQIASAVGPIQLVAFVRSVKKKDARIVSVFFFFGFFLSFPSLSLHSVPDEPERMVSRPGSSNYLNKMFPNLTFSVVFVLCVCLCTDSSVMSFHHFLGSVVYQNDFRWLQVRW